mgnify:CR=1 FL=1
MVNSSNKHGNGTWTKLAVCIMGAITLFSTGWASSSTLAWQDIKRIDIQGTQRTKELEVRVTKLETMVEITLSQIHSTLKVIQYDLKRHTESYPHPPSRERDNE